MENYKEQLGKRYAEPNRSKRKTKHMGPAWIIRHGEWGTEHRIQELGHAYEKRDAMQQEIARIEQKLQRQSKRRKQLRVLIGWKDAAEYIRRNRNQIH